MSISQMLPEALAAKYREFLKPFEGHTQEILDLLAMHPHIASILDSRIVDHNLDVLDPPNGWYARWEIGFQACWRSTHHPQGSFSSGENTITWTFPAEFRNSRYFMSASIGVSDHTDALKVDYVIPQREFSRSATNAKVYFSFNSAPSSGVSVDLFVAGWSH